MAKVAVDQTNGALRVEDMVEEYDKAGVRAMD